MSAKDTLYRFEAAGFPADTFSVLSFEAWEAVSQPGWMRLRLLSRERGLDHEDLIGELASLSVDVNGTHRFAGVVTEFHEEPFDAQYSRYEVMVRDRLHLLELSSHCRVFQKVSASDILRAVLGAAGFGDGAFAFDLHGPYPALDLRIQYNESDLDFLQRLTASAGIFHFVRFEDGRQILTFADDNAAFPECGRGAPMSYRPATGMVEDSCDALYSLRRSSRIHLGAVRLGGYQYESPQTPLQGRVEGDGHGEWRRYETEIVSSADASVRSRLLREAASACHIRIRGESGEPLLRAGRRFVIAETDECGISGELVLLEVRHAGSQEGSVLGNGSDAPYRNEFLAQPVGQPFRAAIPPKPRVPGILVVKVDAPDGPYAHLDGQGRYRVRLPFDESDAALGQASPPIRMAQPYAGPGYGLHLPLHRNADLVLAFEDGDIDRPVALGAVPNPSQTSPVTASNKTENVLRTASGNLLALDDLDGKTRVQLRSSSGRELLLDDASDTAGVLLATPHQHRLRISDASDSLELSVGDGKHALAIEAAKGILTLRTASGHALQLSDDSQAVTVQSAAGHRLCLDDAAGLLTLEDKGGKHRVQIDVGGKISLTTDGDLEFEAKGALRMKGAEVSLESGSGDLSLKSAGALDLQGMNANLKADQKLSLQSGMDVGVKAGTNLKLEGGINVESRAGVANKLTGTMTNVEATGVNTLKGAMVMIN